MLPSVYVILARSLQQKSRLQTNEQCLVNSGVQRVRTSNHFFQFSCKALQTELFRLMQLQETEFNLISVLTATS